MTQRSTNDKRLTSLEHSNNLTGSNALLPVVKQALSLDVDDTKGLRKEKKNPKIRVYYGSGLVGGSRSHSELFFLWKIIPKLP